MKKIILSLFGLAIINTACFAQNRLYCDGVIYTPGESAEEYCTKNLKGWEKVYEEFGFSEKEAKEHCLYNHSLGVKAYKAGKCSNADVTDYTRKDGVKCRKIITENTYSDSCQDGSFEARTGL